jgi:hypothetical protein
MGSFRLILAGPENEIDEVMSFITTEFKKDGSIKNVVEFETFETQTASKILKDNTSFDGYPYLENFQRVRVLNWLSSLENKGYDRIAGRGIWFVSYGSPIDLLSSSDLNTVLYDLEKGEANSSVPFSYDPAQDYNDEM